MKESRPCCGRPRIASRGVASPRRPAASAVELFGAAGCPFTAELREDLEWRGVAYVEHDVESDRAALERMLALTGGRAQVPVLVEDGRVREIGWRGRSCPVSVPPGGSPVPGA